MECETAEVDSERCFVSTERWIHKGELRIRAGGQSVVTSDGIPLCAEIQSSLMWNTHTTVAGCYGAAGSGPSHPVNGEIAPYSCGGDNLKFKFLSAESQTSGKNELEERTMEDILKEKRLEEWHAYWLAEQIIWFKSIGLDKIKIREHMKDELSHYSSATFDIDYEYPFGSKEIAGIANRGQFDLKNHEKESNQNMVIYDEKYKNKIIPKVIEPTFGIERIFLGVLALAYNYDKEKDYTILKIPPKLAPVKASVFPIVKQPEYEKISERIYHELKKEFNVSYDSSGSIGRRYARNDEIGTPFCVTIDEDSLKNKDVTVRLRDTGDQFRIKENILIESLKRIINGENISKFGKKVDTRKK